MKKYTETTAFSFNDLRDSRAVVVDGEVTLNSWDGDAWVAGETLTTGSYEVFTKGLRLQVEITSGTFSVDEGDHK